MLTHSLELVLVDVSRIITVFKSNLGRAKKNVCFVRACLSHRPTVWKKSRNRDGFFPLNFAVNGFYVERKG